MLSSWWATGSPRQDMRTKQHPPPPTDQPEIDRNLQILEFDVGVNRFAKLLKKDRVGWTGREALGRGWGTLSFFNSFEKRLPPTSNPKISRFLSILGWSVGLGVCCLVLINAPRYKQKSGTQSGKREPEDKRHQNQMKVKKTKKILVNTETMRQRGPLGPPWTPILSLLSLICEKDFLIFLYFHLVLVWPLSWLVFP